MTFIFSIHDNSDAIRHYLPGLSPAIETSLWIRPSSLPLASDVIDALLYAFAPQQGILWRGQAAVGIARTEADAFPETPDLVGECVARTVIDYPTFNQSVYTDVSWLASDPTNALTSLLLLPTQVRAQRIMAFLPKDRFMAQKWAKIVQGANWLWLCREWVDTFPVPLLHSDGVMASYVNLTVQIGGTAILLWEDSNRDRGFVLLASHEQLISAAQNLQRMPESESVFEKLAAVGFHLELRV